MILNFIAIQKIYSKYNRESTDVDFDSDLVVEGVVLELQSLNTILKNWPNQNLIQPLFLTPIDIIISGLVSFVGWLSVLCLLGWPSQLLVDSTNISNCYFLLMF